MFLKPLASYLKNSIIISLCVFSSLTANALDRQFDINAKHLALVVNDADPSSIHIAQYYLSSHQIPAENIIHTTLDPKKTGLTRSKFLVFSNNIRKQLSPHHTAVLFVWSAPYKVECQSLTSVFTLGFDPKICAKTCAPSQPSEYFNQNDYVRSTHQLRLSMLLPTHEIDVATKVIDSGVLSRKGVFKSKAYYLTTSDKARNSRALYFPKDGLSFRGSGLSVVNKRADYLIDNHDIMIYQTGAAKVKYLPTLRFLPGALADHLTSFGGVLSEGGQMSVLEWLRAGATASYGTVSEPCNYWQKFPNPSVLLRWYVSGNTAIEAYWKSVAWPAQGLFVGDPLAQPFTRNSH